MEADAGSNAKRVKLGTGSTFSSVATVVGKYVRIIDDTVLDEHCWEPNLYLVIDGADKAGQTLSMCI